jgi:Response regulator containing CheY-like receiver, AAA-type ATPase, and DNA-binding domains
MEVLIIDDEQSITDALQIILSDSGHTVAVAATGHEGLNQASRKRYDLTITDLRLPDMSGLDLLSLLRCREPSCFVIVITAHGTPEIAEESLKRGAFHFLCKPFQPADILALIDEVSTTTGRPTLD